MGNGSGKKNRDNKGVKTARKNETVRNIGKVKVKQSVTHVERRDDDDEQECTCGRATCNECADIDY